MVVTEEMILQVQAPTSHCFCEEITVPDANGPYPQLGLAVEGASIYEV